MNNSNINPTRLERANQIARQKTAKRGHKLLKDKSDEMFRNLTVLRAEAESTRSAVHKRMAKVFENFLTARAHMTAIEIENALNAVRETYTILAGTRNIMGLIVPHIDILEHEPPADFRFLTTHHSFDQSVHALNGVLHKLIELSALEKTCEMLDAEIKLLHRRVNALEYAVIPAIEQNIDTITMKLAENERGNLVRLMKVKNLHNE